MAQLQQQTFEHIKSTIEVASSLGIDGLIIENQTVRGMDDAKTIIIFNTIDVDLPASSIGLNRLDVLNSRLQSLPEEYTVECQISLQTDSIVQLIFSAKKLKIEYRCANINAIVAPKKINDIMKYKFTITDEIIRLISRGQIATKAECVRFQCINNSITISLTDINNDKFEVLCDDVIVENLIDNTKSQFSFSYPTKHIQKILKHADEISIGQKGMLKTSIESNDIYLLPQV